jgi:histidinol-phosphate aminotransferase
MTSLLDRIRPEVRRERPYTVPGAVEVENKLNQNECPFDIPAELKREFLSSFAQIPFNRYPDPQPEALVHSLSETLDHPADGILVGNGSNELTHTLGLCLMTEGAGVVLPRPMFALYESVARMYGARIHGIAPREDLSFDVDKILELCTGDDVNVTVVTSPNNPTGLSVPFEQLEQICETAAGFVVVDEAYHEFNTEQSASSLLKKHPNVIIVRTLSKAFGLAGLRIGYLAGDPSVIQELLKARLPFMVDRFSEHVAVEILKRPEMIADRVQTLTTGIRQITEKMQAMADVTVVPSQTNFVLFKMNIPADELAAHFTRHQVLVRNMSGYPELRGYLRVTAGTDSENKAFFRALEDVRGQSE